MTTASPSPSSGSGSSPPQSQSDEWDEYLHGMFKKLKVDPEQLKRKTAKSEASSKQSSQWYSHSIKTPKKTRKSLALRSARNRLSPYKTSVTCHGAKLTCDSSLIRSSSLTPVIGKGKSSEFSKVWSDFGEVKGWFTPSLDTVCPCVKRNCNCDHNKGTDGKLCKCGQEVRQCQFGSSCKSKLLTFRTLATIVEEAGEVSAKEDAETEKDGSASSSNGASKAAATKKEDIVLGATPAANVSLFMNYRDNLRAASFLPKTVLPSSVQRQAMPTTRNSGATIRAHAANVHVENRIVARPEYSCSQEVRMAEDGLLDDTSVDDLAGYFDSIVYIPRKMSAMAEMMYT